MTNVYGLVSNYNICNTNVLYIKECIEYINNIDENILKDSAYSIDILLKRMISMKRAINSLKIFGSFILMDEYDNITYYKIENLDKYVLNECIKDMDAYNIDLMKVRDDFNIIIENIKK
jgi:hypothetical protein